MEIDSPSPAGAAESFVFDATAQNFQDTVLQKSLEVPVVVDFWADWCGPCRQLGPILEGLAAEYKGKFLLAKVNNDTEQALAAHFGVQALPTVVAFVEGQPVDAFQGVKSEQEVREWLENFIPSEARILFEEAVQLEQTDPAGAEERYRRVTELDAENAAAKIGLARVLLSQDKLQGAKELVEKLETRGYLEPEGEQVKNALEVKLAGQDTGGIEAARAAAEANPSDAEKQIELAEALAAGGRFEEACDLCLSLYSETRNEAAKEAMVKIFDLAGGNTELATTYRRKLARMMY